MTFSRGKQRICDERLRADVPQGEVSFALCELYFFLVLCKFLSGFGVKSLKPG